MKTKPKVSVIVPVYNPGIYFENCLASLINQTLRDIEIILILDCPTDGCDIIAEKYAKTDERVKLIYNEKNIHIGLSRNKGLDAANGEYIGFHDADDYSEPVMYELLYNEAKQKQLDVVRCNFKCVYPKESGINDEFYVYPEITENVSEKKQIYEKICSDTVSCVIWNHIYKADFLFRYDIKFPDTRLVTSEDSVFFIQVYHHLGRLGIVPDYLYSHIFHQTNTGKNYNYRSVKNRISFFEKLYSFLREKDVEEKEALSYLSGNVMKSLYSASRQAFLQLPLKKAVSEIRQIRDSELVMKCVKRMYKKENSTALRKLKPTIIVFFFVIRFAKK